MTNTNPNSTYTQPSTNNFKKNTFNWMQSTFPINKSDYHNFAPYTPTNPLSNPFFSTGTYLQYIAGSTNSDNKPENGWELIKQDFGFEYANNTWDGNYLGSYNKAIAYFVLYNKYSAKLRILATTPGQGSWTADKIAITVRLINHADDAGSNFDQHFVNGLFVNTAPIARPLDQTTDIKSARAIAVYPASTQDFFFADFQLAYDPCICVFESGLEVSFEKITSATINLSGKLIGLNNSIASVSNETGNIFGDNPATENYYSQFFADGQNDVKSLTQHYADIVKLKSDLKTNGDVGNAIDGFEKILKVAAFVGELNGTKPAVEVVSGGLDFFSALIEEEPKIAPTVISAYMKLTGSVNFTTAGAGYDFKFAVPGSKDAETRPEYATANTNGVIPNYPMYNETPGLFALLKTPQINRNKKTASSSLIADNQSTMCSDGQELFFFPSLDKKTVTNQRFTYKLADGNFQFAFNPIVNESKTKIEAAIEIYGIEDAVHCTNINAVTTRTNTNCHLIDMNEDVRSNNPMHDKIPRYRTDFYPLGCIEKVMPQIGYSYFGDNEKWIAKVQALLNYKAYLILNIYYVFNIDAYGKEHYAIQSIKYPLIMSETEEDFEADANFIKLKDVPNNLIIPATTFTSTNTIFSRGTITITGDLINNSVGTIKIMAEKDIIIEHGIIIPPGFELLIGRVSDFFCEGSGTISQQSTSQLTTFCSSNNYNAKNLTKTAITPKNKVTFNKYVPSATVYPNPNSGTFSVELPKNNSSTNLILTDLAGKIILSRTLAAGQTIAKIETNGLSNGIYMMVIKTDENQTTKKIIINNP
ncbi:MAG: T9SS type A sorting domain-containing protein [Bacteroidetes bacterium]|nr:T9SS type A sorting domain-containing protein [Bacteroidota bacterium]